MLWKDRAIDLDQIPSAGGADVTEFRRQTEERIIEIRHRLIVDVECVESGWSTGFLDVEEELLEELRELESVLVVEEAENHSPRAEHWKKSRETSIWGEPW